MRSQWMLLVAVAAAHIMTAVPAHAGNTVKGTGLYRSEQDCLKELPAFARRLSALGLTLTKPLDCEEVQGELDAYAPVFEADSARPMVAETALAPPLQDQESCQASLRELLDVVADSSEVIVEASCVPISVVDQQQDEMVTGQFQPMVVLLKTQQP